MGSNRRVVRGAFTAMVAGALAFGAAQASASPDRAAAVPEKACDKYRCWYGCGPCGGYCNDTDDCICYCENK